MATDGTPADPIQNALSLLTQAAQADQDAAQAKQVLDQATADNSAKQQASDTAWGAYAQAMNAIIAASPSKAGGLTISFPGITA